MAAMGAQGVRWPYPRRVFAQLFLALHQAGAKRIVGDFTFFEESDAMDDQVLANVAARRAGARAGAHSGAPARYLDRGFCPPTRRLFPDPAHRAGGVSAGRRRHRAGLSVAGLPRGGRAGEDDDGAGRPAPLAWRAGEAPHPRGAGAVGRALHRGRGTGPATGARGRAGSGICAHGPRAGGAAAVSRRVHAAGAGPGRVRRGECQQHVRREGAARRQGGVGRDAPLDRVGQSQRRRFHRGRAAARAAAARARRGARHRLGRARPDLPARGRCS
jgi:hypothetical protein